MTWIHPPQFQTSWLMGWIFSGAVVACALLVSKNDDRIGSRIICGISIVIALGTFFVPTYSYGRSYGDLPWLAVCPMAMLTIGGGLLYGQRIVALGTLTFLCYWLQSAFLPPSNDWPAMVTKGPFTLTLSDNKENEPIFKRLTLTGPSGKDLRQMVADPIECRATAGPLVPLDTHAHVWSYDAPTSGPLPISLKASLASWVRRWDLEVIVQTWPDEAAASVTLPVNAGRDASFRDVGKDMSLKVSHVRRSKISHGDAPEDTIIFDVTYEGGSHSGWTSREIRITDQHGNRVESYGAETKGLEGGATLQMEIWPVPKALNKIRVDAFTEDQLTKGQLVFEFKDIPNRR